jgi:hypothetical protein
MKLETLRPQLIVNSVLINIKINLKTINYHLNNHIVFAGFNKFYNYRVIRKSLCTCKNTNIFLMVNLLTVTTRDISRPHMLTDNNPLLFILVVNTCTNSAWGIFLIKLMVASFR